ncbi:GNAT family N-acetyltransferase [Rugosimonospora africana]|uniref:N-acetyltransferase n=1 Tax=Rugosimonospora africana TaxID=556532 RepID=A0A8J3R270_9ACTN|nr:N-acetyltransferase [Rugosimonospora africana]GIH18831.1 N-acetyltransferase [Rugosimonospora africana]
MAIRPFTVTDLASTLALDREAFAEQGYTSIVLRQARDVFDELFRVYEDGDGGIAGYAMGAIATDRATAWILALAVAKKHRGAGIGRALTVDLLSLLRARGVADVLLTVDPANTAAISLYQTTGFTVARTVDDYFGPGERRLVMVHHPEPVPQSGLA